MSKKTKKTDVQPTVETVKEQVVAIMQTPVEQDSITISEYGEKLLNDLEFTSKCVSVDVIRHTAQFINQLRKSEEGNKHNTFSIAILKDSDKSWLKTHCFQYYLNYNKPSFRKLPYIKYLGMNFDPVYNLKKLVEKFEAKLEAIFKEVGIIDKDDNVILKDLYQKWYTKCRIYLHEHEFAYEFKLGQLEVLDEHKLRKQKDNFINNKKLIYSVTNIPQKHIRLTTSKIQKIYEDAMQIKIKDNLFAYTV